MIEIRREQPGDYDSIWQVNEAAFEGEIEANIIDALRNSSDFIISLVAMEEKQVVGHILFSEVGIEGEGDTIIALGLGPMAVIPRRQRQGFGTQLVEAGLGECRRSGYPLVVVLGHPGFYPRFGFVPSKPYGIELEEEIPEDVFMVLELEEGVLDRVSGIVKFHPAFSTVEDVI